jgi:hypothetical protein
MSYLILYNHLKTLSRKDAKAAKRSLRLCESEFSYPRFPALGHCKESFEVGN